MTTTAHQGKRYFILISPPLVGILTHPQEVFDELSLRPQPMAELIRMDTLEEANRLVFQRYGITFHHQEYNGNDRPISMPVTGTFLITSAPPPDMPDSELVAVSGAHSLVSHLVSQPVPPEFGGAWSISSLNGYGTQVSLSGMLQVMLRPDLVYPFAQWHPNFITAINWARHRYVTRFYCHYDGKTESPVMPDRPLTPGTLFIDSHFDERERTRNDDDTLADLLQLGLLC